MSNIIYPVFCPMWFLFSQNMQIKDINFCFQITREIFLYFLMCQTLKKEACQRIKIIFLCFGKISGSERRCVPRCGQKSWKKWIQQILPEDLVYQHGRVCHVYPKRKTQIKINNLMWKHIFAFFFPFLVMWLNYLSHTTEPVVPARPLSPCIPGGP